MFKLIVNADDFGITAGATAAILDTHLAGNVTSTTLMVNMPAASQAAALAASRPTLGVGLHFNLTCGRPLTAHPALTDNEGVFLPRRQVAMRIALGRLTRRVIREELEAQLAAIEAFGITPTHIDSHQHVHAIPPVYRAVEEVAYGKGLPVRIPWRWPGRSSVGVRRRLTALALAGAVRTCLLGGHGHVRGNTGFCSTFDLASTPGEIGRHHYQLLLSAYQTGVVELMVHPAYVDDELRTRTRITQVSEAEARLLTIRGLFDFAGVRQFELHTWKTAFDA